MDGGCGNRGRDCKGELGFEQSSARGVGGKCECGGEIGGRWCCAAGGAHADAGGVEEAEHICVALQYMVHRTRASLEFEYIHSSTLLRNISSAVGFTLSNPTIASAAAMLRRS